MSQRSHAKLPTDLQHARIYDQQRQSLCSSGSDDGSSSDSSSSCESSDDSESGTDSDSENETSISDDATVKHTKLDLDQPDSGKTGNDHSGDLHGDLILKIGYRMYVLREGWFLHSNCAKIFWTTKTINNYSLGALCPIVLKLQQLNHI